MSTATTTTLAMHEPTIVNAAALDISVADVGCTVFVGSIVAGSVGWGDMGLMDGVVFVVGSGVGVGGCVVGVGWVVGFCVGAGEAVGVGGVVGLVVGVGVGQLN